MSDPTPLSALIAERVAATGPLTIAQYMSDCLLHPQHGYYTSHEPFGTKGDFITAPEISQMFGEMIGLCLAQSWLDAGAPAPFTLAELGPGRGTLMADILRATRGVPGFHAGARITLIEASPRLRDIQRQTLAGYDVHWLDQAGELGERALFAVANEFFDALPIRQFQRAENGWAEVMVSAKGDELAFALGQPSPIAALDHRLDDTPPGAIVETCAPALPIIRQIATRIADHGGAALIIDYGGWHSQGDTLQALRDHAPQSPLANPGQADITAHVDFEPLALETKAAGAAASKLTPQGALLERLGITARAQKLAAKLSGEALEAHIAAHRRLTHPQEMGSLFQALAIHATDAPCPAGFEP
ncbi:MAG: class I SAM-dependent methyltransferase [Paracoccaceae bacterium]